MKPTPVHTASYVIAAAILLGAVQLRLVSALFAGMLVHALIHNLAPLLARLFSGRAARIAATAIVATVVVATVSGAAFALIYHLKSGDTAGLPRLWAKLAEIIDGANATLPAWITKRLPATGEGIKATAVSWLEAHSAEVQDIGKKFGVAFVHILIGGILGAMIAVSASIETPDRKRLAKALRERAAIFHDAFGRVVIGQGKISLINTTLTGVYLAIILPMAGIHLPLIKTMLAVTLIVGILPVVGNLISNTVIVLVSASVSFSAAVASLVFLIVLHKGEYFLSAKILGHQVSARAWEMLLAMLVMEAAFGVAGIAVAPVYYAYMRAELMRADLV